MAQMYPARRRPVHDMTKPGSDAKHIKMISDKAQVNVVESRRQPAESRETYVEQRAVDPTSNIYRRLGLTALAVCCDQSIAIHRHLLRRSKRAKRVCFS
jgi:hypothetical protein